MNKLSFLPIMLLMLAGMSFRANSQIVAVDDNVKIGPFQVARIDVTKNDTIQCANHSLSVMNVTPSTSGTAVFEGDYLVFTPTGGVTNQTVTVKYCLSCVGGGIDSAIVNIMIENVNRPLNIIPPGEECLYSMPEGLPFGIRLKFRTDNGAPTAGNAIDVFSSPVVGDLNGDSKPEIVALGVTQAGGYNTALNNGQYINIYNGQDGSRLYRHNLGASFTNGNQNHRSTSLIALANVDNDKTAEIIFTNPGTGMVYAYKPVFNGSTITGMTTLWTGTVSFKAPLSATGSPFNVPHPYVADINGDGVPEVIVYNKVYNGRTGVLLMSWRGAASSPTVSLATSGLADNSYTGPTTQANANNVKNVAMTGRRPGNGTYADRFVATPAVQDIDEDGIQEIITGNRIHKIQINSINDHTQNTYTTIEGPDYVDLPENPSNTTTTRHYLSDGFTRVADIDGDGHLDIIVVTYANSGSLNIKLLVYVWDPRFPKEVKAALTYYTNGNTGNASIPFIGDINGKIDGWDGSAYSKKLPEICILSGHTYINRSTANSGRSGIKFHDSTDEKIRQGTAGGTGAAAGWDNNQASNSNRRFNRTVSGGSGHIIGLTYDAGAANIEDRLKLSWGMEHNDSSDNTGITLFDFDNDGAKDLCYRDEYTLRVISPKRGNNGAGSDYVTLTENESTAGTSVMFRTDVFSGTGFEYPTIADVNLDGSADIIVTQGGSSWGAARSAGHINVYEYNGNKWASSPPVWNQSLYNPLHINDDLTVPAKPVSMLSKFADGSGDSITPYNGAWIQQPIVIEGEPYVPVYRTPDAVLTNMTVELSGSNTKVKITVRNDGLASVNANTPVHFYHTAPGSTLKTNVTTIPIGVDVFANEKVNIEYIIPGNPVAMVTHCRLFDDGTDFPATGYDDCDISNNYRSRYLAPGETTCSYFADDLWYFGTGGGGIAFNKNINGDKAAVIASNESLVDANENSLSVLSPGCGSSLIFYSQHNQLYNALHQPMDNGSFIGHNSVADGLAACYLGDNKYMLFSVTNAYEEQDISALQYHIIDMNLDNGYGSRTFTGEIEASGMSESVELIPIPGTSDEYWLIYNMRTERELRVRKITGSTGAVGNVVSTLSMRNTDVATESYTLKANRDHTMLAMAYSHYHIALFDFDISSGEITLNRTVRTAYSENYGIEFSPNGRYIYSATWRNLTSPQSLSSPQSPQSLSSPQLPQLLQYDVINSTSVYIPFDNTPTVQGGGLKMGSDERLYVKRAGSRYMGVIENPDVLLTAGGYNMNGFDLGITSGGLTFSTGLTPPAICPPGLNQAPTAVDDAVMIFENGSSVCVNIVANDTDPNQSDILTLANVYFLNEADTVKVSLSFELGDSIVCITPKAGAQVGDEIVLMYTVRDNDNLIRLCDDALLRITIAQYPDNISDADCYVEPPSTIWDIERKRLSSVPVHYMATPFVGDLDGDGRVEVVTAGVSSNFVCNQVLIFNDSLQLIRTINLQFGTPQHFTTNLLIADVDNDGFGDIVVGTVNNTLLCYSHTGVKKWGPSSAYSAGIVSNVHYCPSLIISDINGDGYAEILAVDKIYDAATGILLATLPSGGRGFSSAGPESYMPVFADIDNDGIQEVVAGNTVYKVNLNRTNPAQSTAYIFRHMTGFPDGFTSVADIDMDGDLDVIVTAGTSNDHAVMYVWDGATTTQIGKTITLDSEDNRISRAFAGDITGNGRPDISFTYTYRIAAYRYNSMSDAFELIFDEITTDASGATTMSIFDFNQDGEVELVYRDMEKMRIINKNGTTIASFPCFSGTHTEYPVVVDLDKDGHAEILVTGAQSFGTGAVYEKNTYIMHFGSVTPNQWAPARSVWNQHAYNALNVNENLTIPRTQLNPATAFPGENGVFGDSDDVYPYNYFLHQQTILSKDGLPLWATPDLIIDKVSSTVSFTGNSVTINACFTNMGDAPIGSPIFATLYGNTISPASILAMDSVNVQVGIGESGCVNIAIPDITSFDPIPSNIIVRINDRNNNFAYRTECDSSNNDMLFVNPLIMRKNATLQISPPFEHNGTYPNPVSILGNEVVTYTISAVNALTTTANITITDTLPAYLEFVDDGLASPAVIPVNTTSTSPVRQILTWNFSGVPSLSNVSASFNAVPQPGTVASQPLFTNKAWITLNDLPPMPTNNTYHQGAGISIATFSAGFGGNIYNADKQALDYMSTPSSGIIIAPEEGYKFTGWSHDEYVSLRGITIEAQKGIMHYDTLIVYGDVELHANFDLDEPETSVDDDKIFTFKDELFVRTSKTGSIIRIYSLDGMLREQLTIVSPGTITKKLSRGIYVVTINNNIGQKISIE